MASSGKSKEMPLPAACLFVLIGSTLLVIDLWKLVVPAAWVQLFYRPADAVVEQTRRAEEGGKRRKHYYLEALLVSVWFDSPHSTFPPGATLTGGYAVRPTPAGCRSVELSILWYTHDKGPPEMGVCHFEAREASDANDHSLYGTRAFHVRLPAGPFSYEGEIVTIRW
jgi:hypothetical protein